MLKRIITITLSSILIALLSSSCFSGEPSFVEPQTSEAETASAYIADTTAAQNTDYFFTNGNVRCKYYADSPFFFDSKKVSTHALNYKEGEDRYVHAPYIFKAESPDELKSLYEIISFEASEQSSDLYEKYFGSYTDSYFEENILLIVLRTTGSGSNSLSVSSVSLIGGTLTVNILEKTPEAGSEGSCDVGTWLFRIEIPREKVQNVTEYRAQ